MSIIGEVLRVNYEREVRKNILAIVLVEESLG